MQTFKDSIHTQISNDDRKALNEIIELQLVCLTMLLRLILALLASFKGILAIT